jgi:asparagine synthase (glutamine-hydrolysing)
MALSASRASRGLLNHLGLPLRNGWAYRREVAETALRSTRDPVLAHILYDQQTYLQTLLDRQDRMSMGASIECRVPFLDLPTVEAVNGMGMAVRQRDGMNKWAIRRIGRDYLPPEIAARKKHAFGLPLAPWLRGSRAVAGRIAGLPRGSLVRAGVLPAPFARRIVDRWDRGNDGIATLIWNLANLEIWWELFQDGKEPENRHRLPSHPTRDRSASPAAIGA